MVCCATILVSTRAEVTAPGTHVRPMITRIVAYIRVQPFRTRTKVAFQEEELSSCISESFSLKLYPQCNQRGVCVGGPRALL